MKVKQLANGLKIAAMGGAGPIHVIEQGSTEKKLIWPHAAYPYKNDEVYSAELHKLWAKVENDKD